MLVSGVHGSCTRIWHTGLRLALDDAYSLWRSCIFELVVVDLCGILPLPFPPSWLAVVSVQVVKYLHWVSMCDGAWWWLQLSGLPRIPACPACISLGTTTRFHRHLPQAHLLAMSLILSRPAELWTMKSCEMGPTVYRPFLRRLESLTICRCNY